MDNKKHFSLETKYKSFLKRKKVLLIIMLIMIIILSLTSIALGAIKLPLSKILESVFTSKGEKLDRYVVLSIRIPRVMLALLSGVALGAAGAVMQSILRNPLASPFTLGLSNGAAFGAALAIVLGKSIFNLKLIQTSPLLIASNAFVFGALSLAIVYGIAKIKGASTSTLLLSGVAIGSIFSAGLSILKYFSNNEALKDLDIWLMGGFWGANIKNIKILLPIVAIGLIILVIYSQNINAITLGEDVAKTLGINVKSTVLIALISVTIMCSASIAFTGVIGFVGLISPHISRAIIGNDNRYMILSSSMVGALILLLSDTLARTIISPVELPVGIITSVIGSPFFIYIILKKDKEVW